MSDRAKGDFQPSVGEVKFSSRYVYRSEGVSNDPAVIAAIDKWANVCGDVIQPTMGDEGLYDESEPSHHAAIKELNDAQDELLKLLPNAKFLINRVTFDGGYVELSTSN